MTDFLKKGAPPFLSNPNYQLAETMKCACALLALVALFGSADALKAPLGKLAQSRLNSPVAKAGALAALPAVFSAAPVWAKVS